MAKRGEPIGQRLSPRMRYIARGINDRTRKFSSAPAIGLDTDLSDCSIALYFPDAPAKIYQLQMWLPVFEAGPPGLRAAVIIRNESTWEAMAGLTSLPMILAPRLDNVMRLYNRGEFEAVVYVNNSSSNFQSLIFQSAAHIHVNHGESDKISMVSNQVKAYDRVFVAGQAAIDRYQDAVAWLDESKLIPVGRPQLDNVGSMPAAPMGRRTLLYAPTWEGEDQANNYTSIDVYGEQIARALLAVPNARVIYKPHPRIPRSSKPPIRDGHDKVVAELRRAQRADPRAGHEIALTGDILPMLTITDMLVADVSSVTLDYLYLRPDSPLVLTDRRCDLPALLFASPVAAAAHIVDATSVDRFATDAARIVGGGGDAAKRKELLQYYFNGLEPGQSTPRFFAALAETMAQHNKAVAGLSRARGREAAHADKWKGE